MMIRSGGEWIGGTVETGGTQEGHGSHTVSLQWRSDSDTAVAMLNRSRTDVQAEAYDSASRGK